MKGNVFPAPGLHAAILYLRPYFRPPLLAGLAKLGVFVSEHTETANLAPTLDRDPSDLMLLIGEDDPVHARLAAILRKRSPAVLIAVVPPGRPAHRYARNCFITTDDDELSEHVDAIVASAGEEARARRMSKPLLGEVGASSSIGRLSPPAHRQPGRQARPPAVSNFHESEKRPISARDT